MDINHVGASDFISEVISADIPVLVDFTAVWCGPCKMLEPIIEQLAQEWDGKVKIVKLDVDENPELAMQYQIMGVPTLMLFSNGQPLERMTGYQPKQRIVAKISSYL
jgi:thioredoxin 1